MSEFGIIIQVLVNGILFGTMYGIAAIGLSLIFGTMRIIFFAQGVIIIFFAYICYWLFTLLGIDQYLSLILIIPIRVLFRKTKTPAAERRAINNAISRVKGIINPPSSSTQEVYAVTIVLGLGVQTTIMRFSKSHSSPIAIKRETSFCSKVAASLKRP